jgi:hypothetical protein
MESQLTKLAKQRNPAEMQIMSRESLTWLSQKIADIRSPSSIPASLSKEKSRQTTRFQLGGLYCFYYDPKGKDTLPYYDRFPMVLALERYNDGFLGLNLHYLPLQYRIAFLGKLMRYATLDDNNEIQRLRVTYDILQASKRLKEFRPCVKRYLTSQIQSKLLTIQPNEWDIAAFLPLQQFKKASTSTVWKESVEEIRKP